MWNIVQQRHAVKEENHRHFWYYAVMAKRNPHIGSSFECWLDEQGIREEVTAAARKFVSRRTYVLSKAELVAIAKARSGGFASDREVAVFWKRHGIK